MPGLDRRLGNHPLDRDRATVHAQDEAAMLQIREVAPDRLADHGETVCERGDRDSFFPADQGENLFLTLVAEQARSPGVALPAGAAGPRAVIQASFHGQEVLPACGWTVSMPR